MDVRRLEGGGWPGDAGAVPVRLRLWSSLLLPRQVLTVTDACVFCFDQASLPDPVSNYFRADVSLLCLPVSAEISSLPQMEVSAGAGGASLP